MGRDIGGSRGPLWGLLFLLAGAGMVGWAVFTFLPGLRPPLGGPSGEPEVLEPTPEVSAVAMEKLREFRTGDRGPELALGGVEVTSLLRYAFPGALPSGVEDPELTIEGERLLLSARVDLNAFPRVPEAERAMEILRDDTVRVRMDGSLLSLGNQGTAFMVHGVEASGIPLPNRMIPEILTALGRADRSGLPPEAVELPLPAGVGDAYLLNDSLILVATR